VRIDARGAEGELHHVGAPQEHRARGAQASHRGCVGFGFLLERLGAGTRDVTAHVEQVLERHRQAVDRRAAHAALAQPVGEVGLASALSA
jgi:hypothetical protein